MASCAYELGFDRQTPHAFLVYGELYSPRRPWATLRSLQLLAPLLVLLSSQRRRLSVFFFPLRTADPVLLQKSLLLFELSTSLGLESIASGAGSSPQHILHAWIFCKSSLGAADASVPIPPPRVDSKGRLLDHHGK